MGRHCEFKRKSCQAYKAAGERKSGLYKIIDDRNQSFQVFCDFDSEPGFAWNLIQSFSLSQKQVNYKIIFISRIFFFSDYTEAVSGDHPNWHAYLIRRNYFEWLGTQSTHWRATCRYDTDGVVYTDYMRTSLANCNVLTLPTNFYGQCFQFEFINIRGHECVDCTVPLWQNKGVWPLHTDTSFHLCEFNGKQGALNSEDNFGFYGVVNSQHRCSNNSLSTTQFCVSNSLVYMSLFYILLLLVVICMLASQMKVLCYQIAKCQTYSLYICGDALGNSELVGHAFHAFATIKPIQCYSWYVDD
ncbi:unnamed protein product [Porites lobata]|uniref:Fibrinogen C-terminal domain-containing protein n=1 Tax=Porites lobata TaxID=104759 RepID=A0ABN8MTD4_9CNID|nr:unnamed protein product [Porites lobata]